MNDQSLLAVVVPVGVVPLLNSFVARVGNLLSMIGLSNDRIERKIVHFREARAAKTTSKRVLGVMNDLAYHVQIAFDDATPQAKVSLSDLELHSCVDSSSYPRRRLTVRASRRADDQPDAPFTAAIMPFSAVTSPGRISTDAKSDGPTVLRVVSSSRRGRRR